MRPSEFEAIRPHLQEAFDHIDADLKKRQSLENDKELHELFNRLATLPPGAPSNIKLKTLPKNLIKQRVRQFLGAPPKQKKAMQAYRVAEKRLTRHPPITCARIEDAYPWRHSAARAAVDLRDGGWIKEAEAIGEVLSGLPTGLVDGRQPEIMAGQSDAIRAGAERIRTILAICLMESPENLTDHAVANDGRPFIKRLLAGADNSELTPSNLALLETRLKQPVALSTIQQEKQAAGEPETNEQPNIASQSVTKRKRSTERGEARMKLIAALTKHHKYEDGSCLNMQPIGNNALARMARVDQATASAIFKREFLDHGKYKVTCFDERRLAAALKLLNAEFSPHILYGAKPPGEDDHDEG
jgi:hypothetical protein